MVQSLKAYKYFITLFLLCLLFMLPMPVMAADVVPRVDITLNGLTYMELIGGKKETEYADNNVSITSADGEPLFSMGDVRIKGRGNTTWDKPKKPFQIKFSKKQDLLGLGASKKWVLLADYYDPTHLRNSFALGVARAIGIKGTTDGMHVNLYIDGDYIGLYYLCHKPEIAGSVLNLGKEDGVLFELDQPYDEEEIDFYSADGDHFCLKDSVSGDKDIEIAATAVFEKKWNSFSSAARNGDWNAVQNFIDIDSFCRYYLLNEFAFNLDATLTSFYVYTDGEEDVIHAGPAWDFDKCLGNRWGGATERLWAYHSLQNVPDPNSHILMLLLDIPQFRARAADIWNNEMRQQVFSYRDRILETAVQIRDAALYDNTVWDRADFDISVEEFSSWIVQRSASMDAWFSPVTTFQAGYYVISAEDMISPSEDFAAEGLPDRATPEELPEVMSDKGLPVFLVPLPDGCFMIRSSEKEEYLAGTEFAASIYDSEDEMHQDSTDASEDAWSDRTIVDLQTDAMTLAWSSLDNFIPNAAVFEWIAQPFGDSGYRFFNKYSGRYLCVDNGMLSEDKGGGGNQQLKISHDYEMLRKAGDMFSMLAKRNLFRQLGHVLNGV